MDGLLASQAGRLFAVCSLILVLKMVGVGSYTSFLRIRRRIFATPEDYELQGLSPALARDEDIERVRRAHRNDLENILPFFTVGLFYALSGPSVAGARICFVGFAIARILHSFFYIRQSQPHRTVAFVAGMLILLWMTVSTLVSLA